MCVCLCVYSSVLYLNHPQSLLDIVSKPLSSGLPLEAQLMFLSNGCLSPLQQGFPLAFWKLGEESEGEREEGWEGERREEGGRGGEEREGGHSYDARCSCCADMIYRQVQYAINIRVPEREGNRKKSPWHTHNPTPRLFFFKIIYLVAKLDIRYLIPLPRCWFGWRRKPKLLLRCGSRRCCDMDQGIILTQSQYDGECVTATGDGNDYAQV